MPHYTDAFIYSRALDPFLSLDALMDARPGGTGASSFDYRDPSMDCEERLALAQACTAITDFIDSLAPRDQEIVRRVFWHGETQTAVARRFGISKMAVSKAMARIACRGRQCLGQYSFLAFHN